MTRDGAACGWISQRAKKGGLLVWREVSQGELRSQHLGRISRRLSAGVEYSLIVGIENSLVGTLA
ncbi:hypothetical protein MOF7_04295 [Methylobacterium oryzae]